MKTPKNNAASTPDGAPETDSGFLADVVQALDSTHRRIPSKHLYDRRGAELFERICELPEYYPTRTEMGILERRLGDISEAVGPAARVVEYGSGASTKTRMLLRALQRPAAYHPVDISRRQLEETSRALVRDFPGLDVIPCHGDFNDVLELDSTSGEAARTVVFFPGSTIGNLPADDADTLLERTRRLVGDGGAFLLGIDLVKDRAIMEAAYDDAAGVTAEFNLNLLDRMQRELGADLKRGDFEFRSGWIPERSAIESGLVAIRPTTIELDRRRFELEAGDFIHTEDSRKFDLDRFLPHARDVGFASSSVWTDDDGWFGVVLLEATA